MEAFAAGRLKILVATTVIEVGVNVPNATIMVIEHAERFGLAQLHQLRGRVGRGDRQSFCMLLYKAPLGETAQARLKMMRETEDGFLIAEKDLELRGGGEVLGARQSGMPEFRVAEVPNFASLLGGGARRRDAGAADRPAAHGRARAGAAHAALPVRVRRGRAPLPRRLMYPLSAPLHGERVRVRAAACVAPASALTLTLSPHAGRGEVSASSWRSWGRGGP